MPVKSAARRSQGRAAEAGLPSSHSFTLLPFTGVAGHAHRHWGDDFVERAIITRVISLTMLGIAIVMAIWAGYNFQKRAVFLE